MLTVSFCARDTYGPEPGLENPRAMRRYSELLHRIASFNLLVAESDPARPSDDQFLSSVISAFQNIGVDADFVKQQMHLGSARDRGGC
jgi:hypothetical protein